TVAKLRLRRRFRKRGLRARLLRLARQSLGPRGARRRGRAVDIAFGSGYSAPESRALAWRARLQREQRYVRRGLSLPVDVEFRAALSRRAHRRRSSRAQE